LWPTRSSAERTAAAWKDTAVRKVKTVLNSAGLKELGNVLDVWELGVEDLIGAKVEETILDMRTATPSGPPTPPAEPATMEVAL
jgi:hypothetical protein